MLTIENSQISPHCLFNKIVKGPGTSIQSPVLNQKHVINVCHTADQYLTKFHFYSKIKNKIQKNKHKCNFYYVAMPMMTSQILESVDFTKTPKFTYLENET